MQQRLDLFDSFHLFLADLFIGPSELLCSVGASAVVLGKVLERDSLLKELVNLLKSPAFDLRKQLQSTKISEVSLQSHGGLRSRNAAGRRKLTNQKKMKVTALDAAQM